jgi:hypothetical protein
MDSAVAATIARTLLLAAAGLAVAANAHAQKGEPPLFQSDAPLPLVLQAPWAELMKKPTDTRKHVAALEFTDAQGQPQRLPATVETRGLTRRRICSFPPLRLRFVDGTTKGSVFAGQDDLKMVTHCQVGQDFAQYYIQEYVAYRIYNLVTPQSFRVRPLEVVYRDTAGGKAPAPRFAFLIEDLGDMAKRNGLKRDERASFRPGDYDAAATSRLALFQYLLGNTDWDLTRGPRKDECCHNIRVLGSGEGKRIAVPYDFDSAGMVDAEYAAPDPSLPIKTVRERVFRGFCLHNDGLPAARAAFLAQRQAIFQLVRDEPRLNTPRRRALTSYVESFYATLDSDEKFAERITGKCRK